MGDGHTEHIVTDPRSGAVQFRAYRVLVVEGPDKGKEVRLDRGSLVLGSSTDADLTLSDGSVSRAHVKLVPFPDGVDVTDLESKNGTFTGGVRISRARVAPGAEITIGRTVVRLSPDDRDAEIEPSEQTVFAHLHGRSRAMRQMFALLDLVASRDTPILIEGEPGAGKARVAKAIHDKSGRASGTLLVIDAAKLEGAELLPALPPRVSTVLIRHVDELTHAAQHRLHHLLEDGEMDARFLATTRKDLDREVAAGRFDRALLLRLGVVRVRVPPLRERASDLPMLIEDILVELGRAGFELGPADLGRLQAYAWPDNVRELRAVIERAVSLESLKTSSTPAAQSAAAADVVGADLPYKQARGQMIEAFEREYVRGLLARHDGNISKAARIAGIDRVYLHRLIKKYEL